MSWSGYVPGSILRAIAERGDEVHDIDGVFMTTHGKAKCEGRACCIHNPSDHPMKDWPRLWRDDRGLMERVCEHGVGHPDPDDLAHKRRVRGDKFADGESLHGCCGCCVLAQGKAIKGQKGLTA